MVLTSCWSPCIWTNSLKTGCKAIAFYTVAMSVVLMTFVVFDMVGGDSSQLYNPLFEADVGTYSMQGVGAVILVYFLALIGSAGLMVAGITSMTRGLMLFWIVLFGLAVLFQMIFSLWLLGGYYIYLDAVFYAFINWCWMAYNIYCWLVVWSEYKVIEKLQSPNIELLFP